MAWTDAEKQELARLWDEDFTSREIGGRLGKTKGAAIGMARRMGLKRRVEAMQPKPKAQQTQAQPAQPAKSKHVRGQRIKTADLIWRPSTCQFIEGDPREPNPHCSAPVHPDSPYCAEHHARCYQRGEVAEAA